MIRLAYQLTYKLCVVATWLMLAIILGIIYFYVTSEDVAYCRIWHHGQYNILHQQCDKPTHKKLILFQGVQQK